MRKIIAITQLSLDGTMQSPGGPDEDPRGGFKHGGWAMSFCDEAVAAALNELMSTDFDLLLGRRTYEIFAGYWPYAAKDDPIAKAFNRATKHVATNTLDRFDWANTQRVKDDVVPALQRLKASNERELHIWGSGELLQTLIAADLIDEFRIWTCPVILGEGKRLFGKGVPPRSLTLVESKRGSGGVLLNTYRPAGPLAPYSFQPGEPSAAELARRKKLAAEEARS